VVLPGGRRIEVHPDFDTKTFDPLMSLLERPKPCLDWVQPHGYTWPPGSPTCVRGSKGCMARSGIDYHVSPLSGHLFLFCNAHRNRLKVLVRDGSRLWVCAKKLEKGRFTWPQSGNAQGKVVLSHEELSLLLGEIELAKTKHKQWHRKVSRDGHAIP
jgi:IS66 Orf2 like protein